jgi:hypothetical protein
MAGLRPPALPRSGLVQRRISRNPPDIESSAPFDVLDTKAFFKPLRELSASLFPAEHRECRFA